MTEGILNWTYIVGFFVFMIVGITVAVRTYRYQHMDDEEAIIRAILVFLCCMIWPIALPCVAIGFVIQFANAWQSERLIEKENLRRSMEEDGLQ